MFCCSGPDEFKVQVPAPLPTITDISYYDGKSKSSPRLFTTNFAPDFTYASPRLAETATVYARSIVHIPGVANVGVNGLYCVSDSAAAITRVISKPIPVNLHPATPTGDTLVLCDDVNGDLYTSGLILDAGSDSARTAEYVWTFIDAYDNTNTQVLPIATQTLAIDPWLMKLDSTYKIAVFVKTDSTCESVDTVIIRIEDDCIVSIENFELRQEFGIFPNPVSEVLTITHESLDNFNGDIKLFSTEGQLIQLFENVTFGKLTQQIDMSELAKGVYFVKIETDKGTIVQKVVKS
ncbi:MAG: T9SS type A sorting domain-containing protein [Flavobacteriales bacterium]|nr:T9SS type A sorting domain-containing protein [Flavobacteriales bacterium]